METTEIKHPEIEVELIGNDGNAFAIMGNVSRALRRGGVPAEEVKEYQAECMAGDYDHLLQTTMKWVNVS